jgi:hypothetical protein
MISGAGMIALVSLNCRDQLVMWLSYRAPHAPWRGGDLTHFRPVEGRLRVHVFEAVGVLVQHIAEPLTGWDFHEPHIRLLRTPAHPDYAAATLLPEQTLQP